MTQELPKIYAIALIKSLCEHEFALNSNLAALIDSQTFYYELLELFARLNNAGLVSKQLFEILDKNTEINKQDRLRLEAVFSVYKKFGEKIEATGYEMPICKSNVQEAPKSLNLWAKNLSSCEKSFIEFDDMQNEIVYIAQEIKEFVQSGAQWGDFALFIPNDTHKRNYIQLFSALGVPTNYKNLSENLIQFRIKFEQCLHYCENPNSEEAQLLLANLNLDESALEEIVKYWASGDFLKIVSTIAKIEKIDESEINKRIGALINFYKNTIDNNAQNSIVLSVLDSVLYNPQEQTQNTVAIFSNEGESCENIYIPALIESTLTNKEYIYFITPKTNDAISNDIRAIVPKFGKIIPDVGVNLDFKAFEQVVNKCKSKLTLSTFNYLRGKQVQPSVLFELHKNNDPQNFKTHKDNIIKSEEQKIGKKEEAKHQSVISKDEILHLNPSAIANFQNCPKKYFFKNLLKLKEQNDFLASYGTIVHAILEIFNKKYLEKYTKDEILRICDTLFLSKIFPENALELGFGETNVELIKSTDDLSLAQMRDNFYSAANELEKNGFFSAPDFAHCEKKFEFKIENVIYSGRIDCIREQEGSYCVIDYKTGKNKSKSLEYYASEFGVNFCDNKGSASEKLIDQYEYQIPIYFLGIKYADSLSKFSKLTQGFALEYIRPEQKEGGYKKDSVRIQNLEAVEEKIVENLKHHVVDKILTQEEFLPKPELYKCLSCSYSFLCDGLDFEDIENA